MLGRSGSYGDCWRYAADAFVRIDYTGCYVVLWLAGDWSLVDSWLESCGVGMLSSLSAFGMLDVALAGAWRQAWMSMKVLG